MKRIVFLVAALLLIAGTARAQISHYGTPTSGWDTGAGTTTVAMPNAGLTVSADTIFIIHAIQTTSGSPGANTPTTTGGTAITFHSFTNSALTCGTSGQEFFYGILSSGGTVPTSATVTTPDTGLTRQGFIIAAYQGVDSVTPIAASAAGNCYTTNGLTTDAPALTTTGTTEVIDGYSYGTDVGLPAFAYTYGTTYASILRGTTGGTGELYYIDSSSASSPGTNTATQTGGSSINPRIGLSFALAQAAAPTPTPTATPTSSPTPTATPTATPSATPTPSATATPTATPTATSTPPAVTSQSPPLVRCHSIFWQAFWPQCREVR